MQTRTKLKSPEVSYLRWLQYVLYGAAILYFGKEVLIPLSFALLISFVLYHVCAWIERKGLGRLTSIILAVLLLVVLGLMLVALLVSQFVSFFEEWPSLQVKINSALADLSRFFVDVLGVSRDQQKNIL